VQPSILHSTTLLTRNKLAIGQGAEPSGESGSITARPRLTPLRLARDTQTLPLKLAGMTWLHQPELLRSPLRAHREENSNAMRRPVCAMRTSRVVADGLAGDENQGPFDAP
jgi:hypothetical protein